MCEFFKNPDSLEFAFVFTFWAKTEYKSKMTSVEIIVHHADGTQVSRSFSHFRMSTTHSSCILQIVGNEPPTLKEMEAVQALMAMHGQKKRYTIQKNIELTEDLIERLKNELHNVKNSALEFLVSDKGMDLKPGGSFRVPPAYRNPAIPSAAHGRGGYTDLLHILGFDRKPGNIALGCYHDWSIPEELDVTHLRRVIMHLQDAMHMQTMES